MLVLFMFEEVKNAVLLHQSGHKVEIRLAILDAVVTGSNLPLQLSLKSVKPKVLENLLEDVRDRFVLEHAAVGVRVRNQSHGTMVAR